jgi:sarcosine oxidase, subunit alpha
VFSRSFKYHRPRGLYCLAGECPNCQVTVDGEPHVPACMTEARHGQAIQRERGWPSAEHDILGVFDKLHSVLPVGFYYKTMVRPRWMWPLVEPWVRKVAASGTVLLDIPPEHREARNLHPDVLVIGGGVAGLAAALSAAEAGRATVLCDEGRLAERVPPGPTRERIEELARRARETPSLTILEQAPAIGIYEGPLVVINERSFLHLVHPSLIVIATGAREEHGVFPGNDLPGVWLARGAARLAGSYGVMPGKRAILVGHAPETELHAETLRLTGADVVEISDGTVVRALGRSAVTGVVVARGDSEETYACDALVLALGLVPRDELARQASGLPVVLAGEAAEPGCSLPDAESSGSRAAIGAATQQHEVPLPTKPRAGIVCLCEDVGVEDLEQAWFEGFRSTEIIKRYTTATMGPCRGSLCHRHVRAFVQARPEATGPGAGPTTSRPPVRIITLEHAAAGQGAPIEQRTSLHGRHLASGATLEPAGAWQRPERYGDVFEEYWAVRRDVSVMDVGTLGKFLVAGPDATDFVDRFFPCKVRDLQPGRFRYALTLGEHGYVVDDGLVCALDDGQWYLTFTSTGAATAESVLRDWIATWGLEVHLVNLTAVWGAVNVAGPRSRELLKRLSKDGFDNDEFPYLRHQEVVVAGIPCRAIRLGFVGELSYELHHNSSKSVVLWDALLDAGRDLGIRPHGLEALRLLRLEKGHILIGQDTDYDATPAKLNMSWAVKPDKTTFVGKPALERISRFQLERKLVALRFDPEAPPEGAALMVGRRYVGHLTSSRNSPVLDHGIALGWTERVDGEFPKIFEADGFRGVQVDQAFYDPEGRRLRA